MVLILLRTWSPMGRAEEVGKIYLEVRKTPIDRSLMKRVVPIGMRIAEGGIWGISIYEVKPGKVEEAMADLTKRVLPFGEIEGYRLDMEVLMTGAETMPLVGLKMPEKD